MHSDAPGPNYFLVVAHSLRIVRQARDYSGQRFEYWRFVRLRRTSLSFAGKNFGGEMNTGYCLSAFAAVAMAATSIPASAGTRAADTPKVTVQPAKLSAVSAGTSGSALTSGKLGGSGLIISILLAVVVASTVLASSSSADTSPGS